MAKSGGSAGREGRVGTSRSSFVANLSPFHKMVYRASEGKATKREVMNLRDYITNPQTPREDRRAAQQALRMGGYKEPNEFKR